MEGTAVVKSVVLAANQYGNSTTQENLMYLLRQLHVLTGITSQGKSLKFFCPKQMIATECLSCLLDLLNEPNTPAELQLKIMVLLFNLAADSEICETLQVTYNLPATLAACLQVYTNGQSPTQPEHLILQDYKLVTKPKLSFAVFPQNLLLQNSTCNSGKYSCGNTQESDY